MKLAKVMFKMKLHLEELDAHSMYEGADERTSRSGDVAMRRLNLKLIMQ